MKDAAQSRRKKSGTRGEEVVAMLMRSEGFRCVERVNDAWRPVEPVKDRSGKPTGKWVCFKVAGTLSGDIRAVAPDGRSVLVEVKTRGSRLSYGMIPDHQQASLTDHGDAGGISLVGWVADHGTYLIPWPIPGFVKGHGIGATEAAEFATIKRMAAIHPAMQEHRKTKPPGRVDQW